jgi:hypothetical protein
MQQAERGNRHEVTASVKQNVDLLAPRLWRLRYRRYGEEAHLKYTQKGKVHKAVHQGSDGWRGFRATSATTTSIA